MIYLNKHNVIHSLELKTCIYGRQLNLRNVAAIYD